MRTAPLYTVLLDSPDPHRRELWRSVLRPSACMPLEATTVQDAREWVQAVCPDLVLADAALPDGRAVTLLQELRRVPALERVPIVVRGAVTATEQRTLARDPYAQLQQSDDTQSLVRLVEELLPAA